ncbi:hypothetical protein ACFC0K_36285 [Streptomyces hydrogenans]|uniref:hypothetical protein n=1 Tax=Streptomyces hydrogenans TaxID=1873719 RepID=UPI0035E22657
MQTPDDFRAEHGDPATWDAAEFDAYEYLVEAAQPAFVAAAATGLYVYGRSLQHGQVAVAVVTSEYLAWRREDSVRTRESVSYRALHGGAARCSYSALRAD